MYMRMFNTAILIKKNSFPNKRGQHFVNVGTRQTLEY